MKFQDFHYVYMIHNLENNMKYIGVRTSSIEPHLDLGKYYYSSSKDKEFIRLQKEKPELFEYKILSIHEDRKCALLEEIKQHKLHNVKDNDMFYNIVNQTVLGFDVSGKTTVKDNDGNIFLVNCDDQRIKDNILKSQQCGFVTVKINETTFKRVSVDNPKYIVGEFKHNMIGMVNTVDSKGNRFHVKVDDPRYLNGEVLHAQKNLKRVLCVKDLTICKIYSDEQRYISEEYVEIFQHNKISAVDSNNQIHTVDIDDERINKTLRPINRVRKKYKTKGKTKR